jgi:hypothetical protein
MPERRLILGEAVEQDKAVRMRLLLSLGVIPGKTLSPAAAGVMQNANQEIGVPGGRHRMNLLAVAGA